MPFEAGKIITNSIVQSPGRLRFHYIDFSRAVLFTLGIVLHAAWFCQNRSPALREIHDFIHSFRMPAFFIIAGFFCAAMLANSSPEIFLSKRLRRLGIPLLFCVGVDFIVNCPNHTNWTDYSIELTKSYWVSGDWLEHLWFLGTLISYVLLLFGVQKAWPSMDIRIGNAKFSLLGFVSVVVIASFAATHIERLFPPAPWAKLWFFVDQLRAFQYFAFFAAGYVLFHHQNLWDAVSKRVGFNAANVALFWFGGRLIEDIPFGKYLIQLWQPFYALSACGLLFWIAMRFFNEKNARVQSLADASYTVYLVHWPVMVALQRLVNTPRTPVLVIFCLLVFLTAALSYGCHIYLVKRSHLLAFLMNGQPMPAAVIPLDAPSTAPKPAVAVITIRH